MGRENYAEVHGVVDHRFQNLAVVGSFDVDGDVGILPFELGEDLGKNMEASVFVGAHNNLAASDALRLTDRSQAALRASSVSSAYFCKILPEAVMETFPARSV